MKKIAFPIFIIVLLISCNNADKGNNVTEQKLPRDPAIIRKADWLLGKWVGTFPEGMTIETWEKQNDSLYLGTGLFTKGNDTLSSESIRLEQVVNDLFYIPIVKEQNGSQPIIFKMTTSSDSELVFENPNHDFPQKIRYSRITGDSIVSEISGQFKGKVRSESFPMKRMK